MLIRKVIIANRGEIASRVIRTAKRLGIRTVAVHSEADARALHVGEADERVHIGPAAARESYLKIDHILEAAEKTGADAVHPGYGFLSERADFARACRAAGLVFLGPSTATIEAMSGKLASRAVARAAGIPLVPGSEALASVQEAVAAAERVGFPVLLKPVAGGGGIGMQAARDVDELARCFPSVRERAARLFDDPALYLERLLEPARLVEVQLAGDEHGHLVHLGERDCTVQRRHQKLVDEAPSPAVDEALREQLAAAALRLARAVSLSSLATVELLLAGRDFYFLEMSTRLQVDHTVTEMVTGIDLVEWQLRIAMGEELPARQQDLRFHGHAMQCRVFAEDPASGFAPSSGRITRFLVPRAAYLRNDVGVVQGDLVTSYYDPLIGKLIVHGPDRAATLARLQRALADYKVEGVVTNLDLHRRIAADEAFASGDFGTDFLKGRLGLAG